MKTFAQPWPKIVYFLIFCSFSQFSDTKYNQQYGLNKSIKFQLSVDGATEEYLFVLFICCTFIEDGTV